MKSGKRGSNSNGGNVVGAGQGGLREWLGDWRAWWERFWFSPRDPMTLCVLRVLVGGMLFYTHLVWSFGLTDFFGSGGAVPGEYRQTIGLASSNGVSWMWSHFDWLPDHVMWPAHVIALTVFAMFTIGLWTRWTGVLSALLTISYANRAFGLQFGLDQINGFMAIYLALGPSGRLLSVDHWLLNRRDRPGEEQGGRVVKLADSPDSVLANIAIRLIQVHLCVVYLFAGLGKLQGDRWWGGDAIWGAFANHEYQTLDMTWLADQMWLVNLLTFTALTWEVLYPFLVWPRLTRPIFVGFAILVHLGIGVCMGMLTFGLIMVFANLAFVSSAWFRSVFAKFVSPSRL